MAFGSGIANATAWAIATQTHMPPGTVLTIAFDTSSLKRLLKKAAQLQRNKNRVITASMRAGMRVVAKQIKKDLPAYTTRVIARRRMASPGRAIAGQSKLKEAKKAIGTLARISKGGRGPVPAREPEAKVGSNVGLPKRTSADRPRGGRKGMGRGNLHWYLMGTAPRMTQGGVYTGQMRRTMVVSRAWAVTRGLALAKMKRNLAAGIQREASRP